MKKNRDIYPIIFIVFSFFYIAVTIFQNRSVYLKKFDYETVKKQYDQSQWQQSQNISPLKELDAWALKMGYTGWNNYKDENKGKTDVEKTGKNIIDSIRNRGVSDATLYTYGGYEYVNGANPTLLNPEHPPLGKYFIGFSIKVFGNEHVILLIFGLIILVTVFMIVLRVTESYFASSVGVFLTVTHSLFIDQLIHGPQLELFQLAFLLLVILFLMLFENYGKVYTLFLAAFFLGLLLSVKTFLTHFILFSLWLGVLILFSRRIKIREWLLLQTGGLLVFISSYAVFFIKGGTFKQWLGVQKYVVIFYRDSGINIVDFAGNYLRLIFTGGWKFWSGGNSLSHYNQWSLTWSIIFLITMYMIFKTVKHNFKKSVPFSQWMFVSFIVIYNLYLFIVPMFPRYLLLLFIPMIIFISIYSNNYLSYEKNKE